MDSDRIGCWSPAQEEEEEDKVKFTVFFSVTADHHNVWCFNLPKIVYNIFFLQWPQRWLDLVIGVVVSTTTKLHCCAFQCWVSVSTVTKIRLAGRDDDTQVCVCLWCMYFLRCCRLTQLNQGFLLFYFICLFVMLWPLKWPLLELFFLVGQTCSQFE